MTFCLGINVEEGLVGIADTRITSGSECITARKVSVFRIGSHPFFVMTSGLRSVRDKSIIYFEEALEEREQPFTRLFQVVNAYAGQIRRVAEEDKPALTASGFQFNIHAIVGGQLEHDREHRLFMIYPEGNWVEVNKGTPYQIIGETGYGKPVLDRTLKYQDSMRFALKVGCLAFDSTRISAAGVDFPIDVVIYDRAKAILVEHRYEKEDLKEISTWWQDRLRASVTALPAHCIERVFEELAASPGGGNGQSVLDGCA
ncbi:MAG: peptidase [Gammaproteobacteria bacterium]|nr:peptidase [Gammaproteobacteria bacterium]